MKGVRHSEEQIIAILKQGEAGLATTELCTQHGITEQTYYRIQLSQNPSSIMGNFSRLVDSHRVDRRGHERPFSVELP